MTFRTWPVLTTAFWVRVRPTFRLILQSEFSFLRYSTFLQPIAGKLQLPVHNRQQRGERERQDLRRQPVSGWVSYSNAFNGSGNFNVPGLANFTTHGNNNVLAVTWGVHPENLPSLNFSFSDANNDYSVYGANTRGRCTPTLSR